MGFHTSIFQADKYVFGNHFSNYGSHFMWSGNSKWMYINKLILLLFYTAFFLSLKPYRGPSVELWSHCAWLKSSKLVYIYSSYCLVLLLLLSDWFYLYILSLAPRAKNPNELLVHKLWEKFSIISFRQKV